MGVACYLPLKRRAKDHNPLRPARPKGACDDHGGSPTGFSVRNDQRRLRGSISAMGMTGTIETSKLQLAPKALKLLLPVTSHTIPASASGVGCGPVSYTHLRAHET